MKTLDHTNIQRGQPFHEVAWLKLDRAQNGRPEFYNKFTLKAFIYRIINALLIILHLTYYIMKKKNNPQGFTLIEMIGVLAIIGILAAVVAPRVIESIRDAKVTSAVASVNSAKTAAINYYQRYDNFPTDTETQTAGVLDYKADPVDPQAYTPTVGDLSFGDILVYQAQLLEQEKTPVGRPEGDLEHAIGCATVGDALIGGATYGGTTSTMRFKSAGTGTRIVYYFMPNLTTQEAAALATKVNGPFESSAVADKDFIEASLAGSGIDSDKGGLEGANAWFAEGDGTGEYHAYLYVSHQ
jgi:prepilin-type N-terminal cleavage/methylation domain-containing protein